MKELAPPTDLAVFEEHHIRRVYDAKTETWYFSVVDIVAVLTEQADFQKARKYWNKLKERLAQEGSQLVTNCHRLKLKAEDGKQRLTDVANAETLLRLVRFIAPIAVIGAKSGRWALGAINCAPTVAVLCFVRFIPLQIEEYRYDI